MENEDICTRDRQKYGKGKEGNRLNFGPEKKGNELLTIVLLKI